MFQNMASLRQANAWKPLNELLNRGIFFEVLEQRGHRNPRATENPGTTDALRIALDIGARGPINHEQIVALWQPKTTAAFRRFCLAEKRRCPPPLSPRINRQPRYFAQTGWVASGLS
jgi:hypothetical protein